MLYIHLIHMWRIIFTLDLSRFYLSVLSILIPKESTRTWYYVFDFTQNNDFHCAPADVWRQPRTDAIWIRQQIFVSIQKRNKKEEETSPIYCVNKGFGAWLAEWNTRLTRAFILTDAMIGLPTVGKWGGEWGKQVGSRNEVTSERLL